MAARSRFKDEIGRKSDLITNTLKYIPGDINHLLYHLSREKLLERRDERTPFSVVGGSRSRGGRGRGEGECHRGQLKGVH